MLGDAIGRFLSCRAIDTAKLRVALLEDIDEPVREADARFALSRDELVQLRCDVVDRTRKVAWFVRLRRTYNAGLAASARSR